MIPYLLLIPLIFSIIIWFSKSRSYDAISRTNILSASLILTLSIMLAASTLQNGPQTYLNNLLYIDALNAFIILIIGIINFATSLFAVGYMKKEHEDKLFGPNRVRKFYFQINVFIFTMLLASAVNNLGILWVAIEATTLATAFLISFYNRQTTIEAAWKYVIICSTGITLALFGTILFYYSSVNFLGESVSALNWTELMRISENLNPGILRIAFIFIMVGYGTKAGLAPMHTWLSDAHSKSPTPVSALLSGVLLSVAMYGVLRFKIIVDANIGPAFTSNLFVIFGLLSVATAAIFMLVQKNYKRVLAYSSIEHMGIIALGFGFGGALGVFGALFHILNHAMAKAMMFFNAGNILEKFHSAKIANVQGVVKVLPITGAMAVMGSLAIAGSPPFNVFLSEFMILARGIETNFWAAIAFLLLLVLVFAGFIANMNKILFGKPPENIEVGEENKLGVMTIVAMMIALIVLGFYVPGPLAHLISAAADVVNLSAKL